jgi:hypothetical protein
MTRKGNIRFYFLRRENFHRLPDSFTIVPSLHQSKIGKYVRKVGKLISQNTMYIDIDEIKSR